MASFKDLMKAFLYEDVTEETEDDHAPAQPVVEAKESVTVTNVSAPVEQPVQQEVQPIEEAAPAAEPVQEPVSQVSSFFEEEVLADSKPEPVYKEEKPKQKPARKPTEPYRYDRSKLEGNKSNERGTLTSSDYQTVLSPIFGTPEEKEREIQPGKDAAELQKPDVIFDTISLISPMFGASSKSEKKKAPAVKQVPPRSSKKAAPNKEIIVREEQKPAVQEKADTKENDSASKEKTRISSIPKANVKSSPKNLSDFLTGGYSSAPKAELIDPVVKKAEESESK